MAEQQALVTIPEDTIYSVFTSETKIDPILAQIRKEIDAWTSPGIATKAGRDEIKSFNFKIVRSRTYLESLGKKLAAEQKEIPKKIDATRRKINSTLESWEEEVSAPLIKWQNAEDARIKAHTDQILQFTAMATPSPFIPADELRFHIAEVESWPINPESCEEFEPEYARAKDAALRGLRVALENRVKAEAEAAELARLREENAALAAKQREEQIRRDAEEAAEKRAAATAQRERDEAAAREQKLEDEATAAIQREKDTEARLKREADQKAADEATETRRREENRRHCGQINRAAANALMELAGLSETSARAVVEAIAKKQIPHIQINY